MSPWNNPILRRYCRSRLRLQGAAAWFVITLILAAFVYFTTRTVSVHRAGALLVDGERMAIIPLMGLQALILFFLGTGQVAGGITGEADEGVLDYQRLTPMTPLQKMLGYLFGLPVREWAMFALTLPFSFWCFWKGKVSISAWGPVYLVFVSSAVLYHLTGLTAGLVIKNRRWAFLSSMMIIFLLYTVMPQVAKMGLLFFDYVTVWPVVNEQMPAMLPRMAGDAVRVMQMFGKKVSFYNLEFSELFFTLLCQAVIILTLGVMVCRRWRRVESHLLGKWWAVGLFAWLQILLLGNALPLIKDGGVFPSKAFGSSYGWQAQWEPHVEEAISIIAVYGTLTMVLILGLTSMITPTLETNLRGLRRAGKLSLPHIPVASDAATSWPWALLMSVLGGGAWYGFAHAVMESKWFPSHALPAMALPVFMLVLLNVTMALQALSEGWHKRVLFAVVIFLGVVPVMVGLLLGAASDGFLPLATWLTSMSPATGPATTPAVIIPGTSLPAAIERAVPRAFWFWQGLIFLINVWLTVKLRQIHRLRAEQVQV